MKEKKWFVLWLVAFMLGRVWLFGINPFGVALFAVMCRMKKGYRSVALAVVIGMLSARDGIMLLKYMLLFVLIIGIEYIRNKTAEAKGMGRKPLSPVVLAVLTVGMNLLLGMALSVMSANTWENLWFGLLEGISVFMLIQVFYPGIHFFLYEDWNDFPGNETCISMLILVFTSLYAIPEVAESIFSVTSTISYFLVLALGFRYGAAIGAMTGTMAGILSACSGDGMVMIGIYCVLGISIGMFRKVGKWLSAFAFGFIGMGMLYLAAGEVEGILELRALASAMIIFLAIPKNVLERAEREEERVVNPIIKEDIRELANAKLADFSDAFRRLSKSFEGEVQEEQEIPGEEIERIFEELSEKVCHDCVNCNYCWDKHSEETSMNMHHILWQVGQDAASAMPEWDGDFGRRCIRLESYVEYAREKMAVARMNLGWRNRIAQNREVMARQMSEVAAALKSFTLNLEELEEVPAAWKKSMTEELKKLGVQVKKITAKRRKNKLEVAFTGNCQGNGCLTKTDLAKALSAACGISLVPDRDTRNVLSGKEETMFFRQDTRLKVLTGLARMAKSGEQISGDNYSFLELPEGELLMVLADGMGCGERAARDSINLIETLEHLLEAGFEKKSALRLLNTLFVANFEGKTFTTLDMSCINLHSGMCEIMKSGAAATFIRREDEVETIFSDALPVGVDMEAEGEVVELQLQDGDMVIMVSDGVLDGYYSKGRTEEETLDRLIEELPCQNPTDLANQILMNALAHSDREATDDMSVLVAGVWDKHGY
ncbi:MAG: SpoIIE family protein phosphatase [Eubacterium sp.]|nr:SpoIIE family protein phosphatase [Eubacterium sp.]